LIAENNGRMLQNLLQKSQPDEAADELEFAMPLTSEQERENAEEVVTNDQQMAKLLVSHIYGIVSL
jgi:hypothetical protein